MRGASYLQQQPIKTANKIHCFRIAQSLLDNVELGYSSCGRLNCLSLCHLQSPLSYTFHNILMASNAPKPHRYPSDVLKPEDKEDS